MKFKAILNRIAALLMIGTLAVFVLCFSQNIIVRATETYSYYFNDSNAVSKIYTSYSSNEIADALTDYINSFSNEPFELLEDTGYDFESVFDEDDGYNMLILKKAVSKSAIVCVTCLVVTVLIFIYLLKQGRKKALRDMSRIGTALSVLLVGGQAYLALTDNGIEYMRNKLGMLTLSETSQLAAILPYEFVNMAGKFYILIAAAIIGIVIYVTHIFTKPERIFY